MTITAARDPLHHKNPPVITITARAQVRSDLNNLLPRAPTRWNVHPASNPNDKARRSSLNPRALTPLLKSCTSTRHSHLNLKCHLLSPR
jgi:hypothetical protein